MNQFFDIKIFITFCLKFILFFIFFYYGTFAIIGLTAKNGYYVEFIDHYLNYISILKISLLKGAGLIARIFGYDTILDSGDVIRVSNARGVRVALSCLGIGVMSFWAAFILSNKLTKKLKSIWLIGGLLLLWFINVWRIGLFLVSVNKGWSMPLGIDHHTWFNLAAYSAIFIMIYFFEKHNKKIETQ